ncbi:hypothetical protein DXC69_09835 [Paenibacillus polymyxa]|uniref:DUF6809 family protein n=1 Tax=Paenibacillus polymyxa TaxID=1406 RepID=UPI000EEC8218|nr:DUF6809 family protein [Paenibacillus polymyxa]RGL36723.1 hypothetical protein DXC69_09835 [Paenibacillus polymyxa]UMR37934.1 hypothetical protein MJ749_11115 [Paenibacillus polymyxa]
MSILEVLYSGKWYPSERTKPKNPELELVHQKISASMKALKAKLSEQDYELIEELSDLNDVLISILSASDYISGYKAGALTIIEIIDGINYRN